LLTYSRRRFLHVSLLLASLGALAGCGVLAQPAPRTVRLARLTSATTPDGPAVSPESAGCTAPDTRL